MHMKEANDTDHSSSNNGKTVDVSFCAAAQIEALKVFCQFLLAKELEVLAMREKTRGETRHTYC